MSLVRQISLAPQANGCGMTVQTAQFALWPALNYQSDRVYARAFAKKGRHQKLEYSGEKYLLDFRYFRKV